MKKAVTSLGLIVALSPLASAVAQDDANFYLGGRLGVSTMSDNCPAGDCNDTSEGAGGLILGYDFGNAFAIEATYDYLGHFGINYPTTGASTGDLTAFTLAPKLSLALTEATDIYGKVGGAWWNFDSGSGNQDDISLLGAVGLDHRANDAINLRLEYQYIDDMNKGYFDANNHLVSVGMTYHFGRKSEPEPMMVEEVVVVEETVVVEPKRYVFSEADEVELFAFGKSELSPNAEQSLAPMLKRLQDFPSSVAIITGHTDSVGSEAFNQKLSEERAQSVADYFTSNGISADRLSVVGAGESDPVASNDTDEGRAKNRRVDIESPEFVYEE
ncbi:OmpA family protein [Enterovibrio paralichthyis]|uniref:OmpA family protein n=1 Tax=Enterovibrio paralichthyis TaxID=2853805 RepID=UPI001C45AB4A|nr:OmpA family protein [Enterovibrio paralichthyis]MBV7296914.1 OmpA family protein [Enterovibrio paralichthyis]